ncbi:hypothetical protein [Paenibacillus qinlingensis]|uniref:hypothetical protein n=1 Tax=Paenibacillus qinlingensis TaxID=1837343 RepID=UPI0015639105|nr:hypothetical protein [Paenibacillus qinlingensis]NQX60728.1 hypothetical protein [Paenibacillus qinlingensis]
MLISERFPRYEQYHPLVPVWCVTPNEGRVIHRFFDTSPISPSGRYIALFRLPVVERNPKPGEIGQVLLIDLQTGKEKEVASTHGWESQLGSNVQWGPTDQDLFYNDVNPETWQPYGVKLNPFTGDKQVLAGAVFMVSPDGASVATTCPVRARRTQLGYGVMVPDERVPINDGFPMDDGLYITDTSTGRSKLLLPIGEMLMQLPEHFNKDEYMQGQSYGFQCKWNQQGTKLLFVLRWIPNDGGPRRNHVLTMNSDGSDVRLALSWRIWALGGHHINWHPDGEQITMNLNIEGEGLRFVRMRYDGTGLCKLLNTTPGSGHPSIHPGGIYLLTDAYQEDEVAFGDGTVPIRLVDLRDGKDQMIARIETEQPYDFTLRVDPHPAWSRSGDFVVFNGNVDGTRRVYVADLRGLISK